MNTVTDNSFTRFLKANRLRASQVADYLGITNGAVSKWVSGQSSPSKAHLRKLAENDRGWKFTELLTVKSTFPVQEAQPEADREELIDALRRHIDDLQRTVDGLREDKRRLQEEVDRLRGSARHD